MTKRTAQASNDTTKDMQHVLIKNVPKDGYRKFKGELYRKHGLSVSSWFRKMILKDIKL